MSVNIHQNIIDKLEYFISVSKIPNIIFHGASGSGKRTILNNFIKNIYNNNNDLMKKYVLFVNCAHGKGIKFIREELKYFAKCHIHSNNGDLFKSIILSNADKLTIDAQSALRRCIELFSHNTRFFIIIENKYKLLKPILSRFCEIYIPQQLVNNKVVNLYNIYISNLYSDADERCKKDDWLKKKVTTLVKKKKSAITPDSILKLSLLIYENGYSGLSLLEILEDEQFLKSHISIVKRYEYLLFFNRVKKEFRNEKIFILFILNYLVLCSDEEIDNITFM